MSTLISSAEAAKLHQFQEQLNAAALEADSVVTASRRVACIAKRKALFAERRNVIADLSSGPLFWPLVLASHPAVGAVLSTGDSPYIASLRHIESEDIPNGFRLRFFFDESPGFDAVEVGREYCCDDLAGASVSGCVFSWRQGHTGGMFFRWLQSEDDVLGLGEVVRDEIIPEAIDYFFGTV